MRAYDRHGWASFPHGRVKRVDDTSVATREVVFMATVMSRIYGRGFAFRLGRNDSVVVPSLVALRGVAGEGKVCFINAEVWVDLSMEEFFSHNQVKTASGCCTRPSDEGRPWALFVRTGCSWPTTMPNSRRNRTGC